MVQYRLQYDKYFMRFSYLATCFTSLDRSSHRRCSVRKGVLRNFAKYTGKRLCPGLFFNKDAACNFIKKETLAQVFSYEFCEISKNNFFTGPLCATVSTHKDEI